MLVSLLLSLWPELSLIAASCVLFLLSALKPGTARSVGPMFTVLVLAAVGVGTFFSYDKSSNDIVYGYSLAVGNLSQYIRLLVCGGGVLFVLLAWPGRRVSTSGNGSLAVGSELGEYFALMLLSLAGALLTADANNLILLFLGLELASIPTYIMVSISRPLAQAQEAGVKYFFLGAMAAAIMLLGFSYLYGATGTIQLAGNGSIAGTFQAQLPPGNAAPMFTSLQELAVILLISGFAFKMAAFPMNVYAADVYQGAASPLTAMLSVVPKTTGLVAIIKVLQTVGGADFAIPHRLLILLAVLAAITMTIGNIMALLQFNVKRTMAYSSVAQSGYLLAGVVGTVSLRAEPGLQKAALAGVLVYLATYAVMNTGVFAVLQQLPARRRFGDDSTEDQLIERGAASAETFEDMAGYGRHHPLLGLAMAICCLSLIGVPATAGFLGKLLLAKPLLDGRMGWLLVILFINAAVSAGYYLRIPATLFFRPLPESMTSRSPLASLPASLAASLCAIAVLVFGIGLPLSNQLTDYAAGNVGDERLVVPASASMGGGISGGPQSAPRAAPRSAPRAAPTSRRGGNRATSRATSRATAPRTGAATRMATTMPAENHVP